MGENTKLIADFMNIMIFLSVLVIVFIFWFQMRLNTELMNTLAVQQTINVDEAASKMDQGYYDGDEYFLRTRNAESADRIGIRESYNGRVEVQGTDSFVPDPTLGIPSADEPYRYGRPYGFTNYQKFRWKTIFSNNEIDMSVGRTGVNRGNFGDGYAYEGTTDKINIEINN